MVTEKLHILRAAGCRFAEVCVTFLLLPDIKGLKNFPTLKYVNYDNLRGPQRRFYRLIYILTTLFYVAAFGWLSK